MMPDLVNDAYQFYTSHMFDRYRDRFLLDGNLNKTDVINRFFENNNLTNLRTYNAPKYPESLFAQTSDGVLCGDDLSPNIVEYKTFITTEMLYDEQLEISEELLIGLNNAERR